MLREYSLKARSFFPSEEKRLDSGFALPATCWKPCPLQPSYHLFHCTPSRFYFPFITAANNHEQGKKYVE